MDVYKRLIKKEASEKHYLVASRLASVCWGLFAITLAERASRLGTLVEAVNILGSVFYGTVLGVFVLAFFFKSVKGTAVFCGAICGQLLVLYLYKNTDIVYLWYNPFGCFAVVVTALLVNIFIQKRNRKVEGQNE